MGTRSDEVGLTPLGFLFRFLLLLSLIGAAVDLGSMLLRVSSLQNAARLPLVALAVGQAGFYKIALEAMLLAVVIGVLYLGSKLTPARPRSEVDPSYGRSHVKPLVHPDQLRPPQSSTDRE